jgi:hypothetical protein
VKVWHLLKLHNVRVHETPVVLNFPLHILRDLQMSRKNVHGGSRTPKLLSANVAGIGLLG